MNNSQRDLAHFNSHLFPVFCTYDYSIRVERDFVHDAFAETDGNALFGMEALQQNVFALFRTGLLRRRLSPVRPRGIRCISNNTLKI